MASTSLPQRAITSFAASQTSAAPDQDCVAFAKINGLYLWCRRKENELPITKVCVLHDSEPLPEGFEKLEQNLAPANLKEEFAYIAFSRQSDKGTDLLDIKIVDSEAKNEEGYVRLEKELNHFVQNPKDKLYLSCKFLNNELNTLPSSFNPGDLIDVKDSRKQWCVAEILKVELEEGKILIHYVGWSDKWNESIKMNDKSKIAVYRTYTKGDNEKVNALKENSDIVLNLLKNRDAFSEEDLKVVQNSINPFLKEILNSVIDSKNVIQKCTEYFNLIVELCIKLLKEIASPPEDVFFLLIRLFGGDKNAKKFYELFGVTPAEQNEKVDGSFAVIPKKRIRDETTSIILVKLLNSFGERGGFDLLLEKISFNHNLKEKSDSMKTGKSHSTNPEILINVLQVLHCIYKLIEPKFAIRYFSKLRGDTFESLKSYSNEELKLVNKEFLAAVLKYIEIFSQELKDSDKISEMFVLDFSLKLLDSPFLSQKILGVSKLVEMVDMIECKENINEETATTSRMFGLEKFASTLNNFFNPSFDLEDEQNRKKKNQKSSKYLTSRLFSLWLKQNQILEKIFVCGTHQELLRRCARILRFLALKNFFLEEHVELIWNALSGQHETVIRVIFDIICDSAAVLSQSRLDEFYDRICKKPSSEYTEYFLEFVSDFSKAANQNISNFKISKGKAFRWYGLDMFWQLIQDKNISESIVNVSCQSLLLELKNPSLGSQRIVFLGKCMDNLKNSYSVCQSLKLFIDIIKLYELKEDERYGNSQVKDIIARLSAEYDMLNRILVNFVSYKELMKRSNDPHSKIGAFNSSRFSHIQEIEQRLEFLEFIIRNSDLKLQTSSLEKLWNIFLVDPISSSDPLKFFKWLTRLCDQNGSNFADGCSKYIFFDLLCAKLDSKASSYEAYICFETFLRHLNGRSKIMSKEYSIVLFDVLKFEIQGLEHLWKFAILSSDPTVIERSMLFLISLYIRLDKRLNHRQIWKGFIEHIMENIKKLLQSPIEDRYQLENLVGILKLFIDSYEFRSVKDHPAVVSEYNKLDDVDFKVQYEDGKKEPQNLHSTKLYSYNTVGETREKIAHSLGVEVRLVRMVYNSQILFHELDKMTFASIGLKSKEIINVLILNHPDEDQLHLTDLQGFPKTILSNEQKYFQQLFDLLSLTDVISLKVWKLLELIPRNELLLKSLENLAGENINWDELIDASSNLKSLYSLSILCNYVFKNFPKEVASKEDYDQKYLLWSEGFIKKGGLAHLLKIFQRNSIDPLATCSVQGLQSVDICLKLINHFLSSRTTERALKAFDDLISPKITDFVDLLLHALGQIAISKTSIENIVPEIGEIAKEVFCLLKLTIDHESNALNVICNYSDMKKLLVDALLRSSNETLRREFAFGLQELCNLSNDGNSEKEMLCNALTKMLFECLWEIPVDTPNSDQFFGLIEYLLNQNFSNVSLKFSPTDILPKLVKKIKDHPILEERSTDCDHVLKGILELTASILNGEESNQLKLQFGVNGRIDESKDDVNLVEEIFWKCLFQYPTPEYRNAMQPPKCKSKNSRKAAFLALEELCMNCPQNYHEVLKYLLSSEFIPNTKEWNFVPRVDERSNTGYVGMKNLGCICYSNSLMQQIFMIPRLRKELLAVTLENLESEECFFIQFQIILASLQESYKQFVDPAAFFKTFKEWDGSPTDITLQKDANEFLNMLFDRIDTKVQGTVFEKVLKNQLGGSLSNQLICKGCPHSSHSKEPFYCITLEVKNKRSIIESLDSFVEGEMLQGENAYLCSLCNKKVDTLKRTVIKELPPTIILHLKRFELDYETMRLNKINAKCEFPSRLNFKNYTEEGINTREIQRFEADNSSSSVEQKTGLQLPDDYYEYELKGILVHMGSANGGHYYSYIKERSDKDEKNCRWLEFNDLNVSDFDPNHIPEEAFGGEEIIPVAGSFGTEKIVEKNRSAYMLFYDRIEKASPGPTVLESNVLCRPSRFHVDIPEKMFQKVWNSNISQWRDQYTFDINFFQFIFQIVSNYVSNSDKKGLEKTMEFLFHFLFKILFHSKEKEEFSKWNHVIFKIFECEPLIGQFFMNIISENKDAVLQGVLISPHKESRSLMSDLIILSCKSCIQNGNLEAPIESIKMLISGFELSHQYVQRSAEYFAALSGVIELSDVLQEQISSSGAVLKLLDYYIGEKSLSPKKSAESLIKKTSRNIYYGFISLLITLTVKSGFMNKQISSVELGLISSSKFITIICADLCSKKQGELISKIIKALCWENMESSEIFISVSLESLEKREFDEIRTYFRVFSYLMKMEDSFREVRSSNLLKRLIGVMDFQKKYWKFMDYCIEHLIRLAKFNDICMNWMRENIASISWISEWISANINPPRPKADDAVVLLKTKNPNGPPLSHYGLSPKEKIAFFEKLKDVAPSFENLSFQDEDSDSEFTELKYQVGQLVDCMDKFKNWYVAKIQKIERGTLHVHFIGYDHKWDEYIEMDSNRIADLHTHTSPTDQQAKK